MVCKSYWMLFAGGLPLMLLVLLFTAVQSVQSANIVVNPGDSIQVAIDQANPGDTIIINPGQYQESLTLNKAVSLTGVMSMSTVIQAEQGQRVLTVTGGVVDKDVRISGLSLVQGQIASGQVVCPDNCGGGILLTNNASPMIDDVYLNNNRAYRGGAIYAEAGSLLLVQNSMFEKNAAVLSGGAAYADDEATISGSLFRLNESENNVGGALRLVGDTSIEASQFLQNSANCTSAFAICHGGAIYAFEVDLTIVNSVFDQNSCNDPFSGDCDGGAVYLSSSFVDVTLTVADSVFAQNTADGHGGAVLANSFRVDVTVENGRFQENTANNGTGGAIAAYDLDVVGTQFLTNTAVNAPGAFDVGGGALAVDERTSLLNVLFSGNATDLSGGAVAVDRGPFVMTHTQFLHNEAGITGGALHIGAPADFSGPGVAHLTQIVDSVFAENHAGTHGGAVLLAGPLAMTNTDFLTNTAAAVGGGLCIYCYNIGGYPPVNVHIWNGRFAGNQSLGTLTTLEDTGGRGGAIAVIGSDLHTNHVTFSNNEVPNSQSGGGAVYVTGRLLDTNGRFASNRSLAGSGGGFFANGDAILTGTELVGNWAKIAGGGGNTGSDAILTTVSLQHNVADSFFGGGMYAQSNMTVTNATVMSNTAVFSGGGLVAFDEINVQDSYFAYNQSGTGGALGGSFDPVMIANAYFLTNTAVTGNGGAVGAAGNVHVRDSLLQNNLSQAGSGGALGTNGTAFLTGTQIIHNQAQLIGGGLYANSGVRAQGLWVEGNTAVTGNGGGIGAPLGQVYLHEVTIADNHAGSDGGGLAAFDALQIEQSQFNENNAQNNGGAIFLRRRLIMTGTQLLHNQAGNIAGGAFISTTSELPHRLVNNLFAANQAQTGNQLFVNIRDNPNNLDGEVGTMEIIYNTFAAASELSGAAVEVITGNVHFTNTIIASHQTGIRNTGGHVTTDHHLYHNNAVDEFGVVNSTDFILGDPHFIDATHDDYRLDETSSGLDNGVDVGILTDLAGNSRPVGDGVDRGAFERIETETAVFLPIILNNYDPGAVPPPDLIVTDLVVWETGVSVTIKNQGAGPTTGTFWVDVYIDPDPVPTTPNQTWKFVADEGLVWGIDTFMQAGESRTLIFGDANYAADESNFSGTIGVGVPIYAQVDSAHTGTNFGGVLESHEITGGAYNNVFGPVTRN